MVTRRLALAAALLGAGVAAAPAAAEDVVVRDREGRAMQFQIDVADADVRDYARILRRSIHGPEIGRVTVRVASLADVVQACGDGGTSGCYLGGERRGLIVIPAGEPDEIRHVLLHEYGHHVDAFRGGTRAAREPNGTWRWWVARGMSQRLRTNSVAHDLSLGWSRSVGEVFAEDYVQLHQEGSYSIPWLRSPRRSILAALHEDITGSPELPPRANSAEGTAGALSPALGRRVVRRGVLRAGETGTVRVDVRRPDQRVSVFADLRGVGGAVDARAVLRCEGAPLAVASSDGGGEIALAQTDVGPGVCGLVVSNRGTAAVYSVTVTVEPLPRA